MTCNNCKHWIRIENTVSSKDMGKCSCLSAKEGNEYPETEETGIESTPLCSHDGGGVNYETKSWFGCIHSKGENTVQCMSCEKTIPKQEALVFCGECVK